MGYTGYHADGYTDALHILDTMIPYLSILLERYTTFGANLEKNFVASRVEREKERRESMLCCGV
jgi:hypothetical protein